MRPSTTDGGSSHRSRSAKERVPEFSLQINRIFRLFVVSSSRRARMRTAIDLDLPAPNNPWMQRSSRLVSSAMVTAHNVPRTCPSGSAANESAVLRVQWYGSPVTWQGMRTNRNNCPHRYNRCDRLSPSIPSTAA